MTPELIRELLSLRAWNQRRLSVELDMSESTICKWLNGESVPIGPAAILMRQWLEAARAAKAKNGRKLAAAK